MFVTGCDHRIVDTKIHINTIIEIKKKIRKTRSQIEELEAH